MDVLTPWFPARIKPKRPGAYLTRLGPADRLVLLMIWTGFRWKYVDGREWAFAHPDWCGLAFDPSRAVECQDAETGEPGVWAPVR